MRLADILQTEYIKIPLNATERDSAIHELMMLLSNKISDYEQVYQAVLEREKVMTTGVGNGIAIPHCKHGACSEFLIALGISEQGINFNAVDNKDVKLIFLLLGPEDSPNTHIKLLSRISRLLNSNEIRTELVESKTGMEAHSIIEKAEESYPEL
jgi:fructose-specific phosphotransferase system IIA component